MKFAHLICAAAIGANTLLGASAMAQQTYTALSLGNVTARSLNSSGQVAGTFYSDDGTSSQAFFTGVNGIGFTLVNPPPGGLNSWGNAINDSGQVVGEYADETGTSRGFITGAGGQGVIDVSYPGASRTGLTGINSNGQAVGWADLDAIATGPNGSGWQNLALNGNADFKTASGINASGQIVGSIFTGESVGNAFITGQSGQGVTVLGTLGGTYSYGSAVNRFGQVVGESMTESGAVHPFLTDQSGALHDLGVLGDMSWSSASGVNDLGQVVGSSSGAAFITQANGQNMVNLNGLVVDLNDFLTAAYAINNSGQVIAQGLGGQSYLLTPTAVPEGQTGALMLMGFGAISLAIRRKKQLA